MPPTKRKLAVVQKPASPVSDHEDDDVPSEEKKKTTARGRVLRPRRVTKPAKKKPDSDSDKSSSEEEDMSEFSENDSDVDFGSRKKKGKKSPAKGKNGVKGRKPGGVKPPKKNKVEPEYSDEEEEKIGKGNGVKNGKVKGHKPIAATKAGPKSKKKQPTYSDEEEEQGASSEEEEEKESDGSEEEDNSGGDEKKFKKNASTCQKCKKEYKNAGEASNCLNKHNVVRCYFCFSLFKTTEELFDHFRDDHKTGAKTGCVSCTHCSLSIPYKSVSCHMISIHMT